MTEAVALGGRLALGGAVLLYAVFAVRDELLHRSVRAVRWPEQLLHGLILASVLVLVSAAFGGHLGRVAGGALGVAAFGLLDELGFHGGVPSDEHRAHARGHMGLLLVVILSFLVVLRLGP